MEYSTLNRFPLLLVVFIISVFPATLVSAIGINYGQVANNLPPPENVVPLVKEIGATKVKLYDADPRVLKAFANSGVEFIVGLGNEYLSDMNDPVKAQAWVKTNVQAYLPSTKITTITIGNEVLTYNDSHLTGNLLPAMENIHTALVNSNLDKKVKVTTAHRLAVLDTSYPPSAGTFRRDLAGCITQICNFHMRTGSPFMINAYPYFAYEANPKQVAIDFVLFQSNSGIVDPQSNLKYDNMLVAQIDAVYAALGTLGFTRLPVQISETGWPSKGDDNEAGASVENAKKYNGNLLKLVSQRKGTPSNPKCELDIFVFALFNENLKPGPTSERNYGLFKPDGTPAYSLGFSGASSNTTGGGGGGTGKSPPNGNVPLIFAPPDGYAISSATGRSHLASIWFSVWLVGAMVLQQLLSC